MAKVSASGVSASAGEVVLVMGAGVGCIVLLYWLAKREVKGAVETVGGAVGSVVKPVVNAVNPGSQTNVVQQVGTAIVRATDQKAAQQGLTLSTKIVDWLNLGGVNDYDPNADTPRG